MQRQQRSMVVSIWSHDLLHLMRRCMTGQKTSNDKQNHMEWDNRSVWSDFDPFSQSVKFLSVAINRFTNLMRATYEEYHECREAWNQRNGVTAPRKDYGDQEVTSWWIYFLFFCGKCNIDFWLHMAVAWSCHIWHNPFLPGLDLPLLHHTRVTMRWTLLLL